MDSSSTQAFELHKAEYESLRAEILAWQTERSQSETWSAAGILGIYAWLATHPAEGWFLILHTIGWWVPVGAAFYCRCRIANISKGIRQAGKYLAAVQDHYADHDLKGWEARLRNFRKAVEKKDKPVELNLVSELEEKLWSAIIGVTLAVAIGVTAISLPHGLW